MEDINSLLLYNAMKIEPVADNLENI